MRIRARLAHYLKENRFLDWMTCYEVKSNEYGHLYMVIVVRNLHEIGLRWEGLKHWNGCYPVIEIYKKNFQFNSSFVNFNFLHQCQIHSKFPPTFCSAISQTLLSSRALGLMRVDVTACYCRRLLRPSHP